MHAFHFSEVSSVGFLAKVTLYSDIVITIIIWTVVEFANSLSGKTCFSGGRC